MTEPMTELAGKRILLGLTGGIAAYKAAELARLFVKSGADVQVVMTSAACGFVTPATMQALSGKPVYTDMWDGRIPNNMGHIELSRDREVFVVLLLDAQHRVIAVEELFSGTLTQTSVYPREVVKIALRHNAAALIFAHNHPSGVAEPSSADEMLTRTLKTALALVDIQVLDHFVVAGGATTSFAERGLL